MFQTIYNFLSRKWYFDRLYNQVISNSVLSYSLYGLYINIDRGLLEKIGPAGSVHSIRTATNTLNWIQSGNIKDYLYFFIIAIFVIVFSVYSPFVFVTVLGCFMYNSEAF